MKKLLARGILFVLIGILLIQGLAATAQTFAPDGTSTFYLIDKRHVNDLQAHRADADALVLGNSHGDNISFSVMGYNGYPLARAWGDFFEIQYYLSYFVPKLPNLDVVFIPVSYFSFSWDNASVDRLVSRRSQIYSILPSLTFIEGDLNNYVSGNFDRLVPVRAVVREDHWQAVVKALASGKKDDSSITSVLIENCDFHESKELADSSKPRVQDTVKMAQEIRAKRPDIEDQTYQTVREIIQYLQARNIRVVFFTPPYFEQYTTDYQQLDPEAIAQMTRNMQALQREFGVEYYDFSEDASFSNDFRLFKDSDHLNLCGKELFSKSLNSFMVQKAIQIK